MMMIGTQSLHAVSETHEATCYVASQGYLSKIGWSPSEAEIVLVRNGTQTTTHRQDSVSGRSYQQLGFVPYRGTDAAGRVVDLKVNLL